MIIQTNGCFYIKPVPNQYIRDGITITYDKDTETTTDKAVCDINKGQSRYKKPTMKQRDNRKIVDISIHE